jgi:3',5'-cyclic AMP phosphodiesterase CpdA
LVTFGIVTDLHFGPEARFGGKLRKLTAQAPSLARAFARRMREEVRPDFVVCLGDAIEDESPAADRARYQDCLAILREAGTDLVCVAGNHDRVHLAPEVLRTAWGSSAEGPLYSSFDRGGVHFVVLYTHERKDVEVTIDAAQLGWLEGDLAATTLPTVVLMHHSAAEQDLRGNRWFEGLPHLCLVRERKRLRELLARSGRTLAVFNGHLHWNHLDVLDGIPYVTLQSLIENVEEDAPGTAAAAHAVVRVGPRRVTVEVAGVEPARYQLDRA